MVAAIIEGIVALFKAIPFFDKWFTKKPEKKLEDIKEDIRKEMDDFDKTGRPS